MKKVFRGTIVYFTGDPSIDEAHTKIYEDGVLVVEDGLIKEAGDFTTSPYKNEEYTDYSGKIICPGFIDTHLHYPQTGMIASYGEQLLEWLQKYAFPEEKKFEDKGYSDKVSAFFLNELLKNGTTTALVMPTVHKSSVDSFFEEALKRNMRVISGKVMMDRNAPSYLLDTEKSSYDDSKELIKKWHKKERLLYAVTPRFAPTSTDKQLEKASELLDEFDGLYMHSHVAENRDEVKWVKELFPKDKSYQSIYDRFGLMRERSIFAHAIYLSDDDYKMMNEKGSSISFCPTSNLFIGSGLFDLNKYKKFDFRLGIGTDVGGGTSFSILKTLAEAYKVSQLNKYSLSPLQSFYFATLGGAKSLYLDDKIGSFESGKEADFIVLDPNATDLMKMRAENAESIIDILFILMILGDERNVNSTYLMGQKV
ncbi:MAG: guanine deaminase [Desulfobacterales bacterium]|nr:guanine deaminase [Desulfobacterales bacterium]